MLLFLVSGGPWHINYVSISCIQVSSYTLFFYWPSSFMLFICINQLGRDMYIRNFMIKYIYLLVSLSNTATMPIDGLKYGLFWRNLCVRQCDKITVLASPKFLLGQVCPWRGYVQDKAGPSFPNPLICRQKIWQTRCSWIFLSYERWSQGRDDCYMLILIMCAIYLCNINISCM